MKEISYIHSEAYQAGELKHGPIALVEKGTLIIAICTQGDVFEKMLSNIKEVKARGAYIVAFAQSKNKDIEKEADTGVYQQVHKSHYLSVKMLVRNGVIRLEIGMYDGSYTVVNFDENSFEIID